MTLACPWVYSIRAAVLLAKSNRYARNGSSRQAVLVMPAAGNSITEASRAAGATVFGACRPLQLAGGANFRLVCHAVVGTLKIVHQVGLCHHSRVAGAGHQESHQAHHHGRRSGVSAFAFRVHGDYDGNMTDMADIPHKMSGSTSASLTCAMSGHQAAAASQRHGHGTRCRRRQPGPGTPAAGRGCGCRTGALRLCPSTARRGCRPPLTLSTCARLRCSGLNPFTGCSGGTADPAPFTHTETRRHC